ncbi:sensor histidine kinase [Niabella sp. 22666]|uniref:sensor histidine kinase n=1 Tax=Niabella sp. 22666 TaxID=3453954 RepID=UPI003F84EBA2
MHATKDPVFLIALLSCLCLAIILLTLGLLIARTYRHVQQRQRLAFMSELEVLKKERARIAADLHDELSPKLILAYRLVEAVSENRGMGGELFPLALENLLKVSERIRGIAADLYDEMILKDGLERSIQQFISQHEMLEALRVDFRYEVKETLSDTSILHLYRIVQEMVNNTLKHSGAEDAQLKIISNGKYLSFGYRDFGTIRMDQPIDAGVGIKSLYQRVMILGANLFIDVDQGVAYYFKVPLTKLY